MVIFDKEGGFIQRKKKTAYIFLYFVFPYGKNMSKLKNDKKDSQLLNCFLIIIIRISGYIIAP